MKLRMRHSTARRLVDLPVLSSRFACGDLSLDQVEAISKMATAETDLDRAIDDRWNGCRRIP